MDIPETRFLADVGKTLSLAQTDLVGYRSVAGTLTDKVAALRSGGAIVPASVRAPGCRHRFYAPVSTAFRVLWPPLRVRTATRFARQGAGRPPYDSSRAACNSAE